MKRLVRFVIRVALVAGAVAAARALTRRREPLPTAPTGPTSAPWPPLRNESPVAPAPADAPAPATPAPNSPATATPAPTTPVPNSAAPATAPASESDVVFPEPDGVPVAHAPTTAPTPAPAGGTTSARSGGAAWVAPTGDGECPDGFPIKAKLSSKIFHSPGQLNYDRTTPDRCYRDATAAEADGLRAAKR